MAKGKYSKDICTKLLRAKHSELAASGEERLPQRSDFTAEEVVAIKAFLGPWPRALEAAGLKPPRSVDRLEHNREKRTRAEYRRIESLKAAKKASRAASAAQDEKASSGTGDTQCTAGDKADGASHKIPGETQ